MFYDKIFLDEDLTLPLQDYTGTALRTDGYYSYSSDYKDTLVVTYVLLLHRNGISMSLGGYISATTDEVEKRIADYHNQSKFGNGVFIVNGDTVQQEEWIYSVNFASFIANPRAYPLLKWGIIENDTTIHFIKQYRSEIDETRYINETWRFKQFDDKPDSTNCRSLNLQFPQLKKDLLDEEEGCETQGSQGVSQGTQ